MRNKIALSLLSALLLSAGWMGATGLGVLASIVPLLIISGSMDDTARSVRRMAALAALTFAIWSTATTWWIWHAAPIGAILSVLFTTTLCTLPIVIFHLVSRRAPISLAYTLLVTSWMAGEWLYNTGELSFPWLFLGNAFMDAPWAVQWYEYTGIFGGSLWILLSNIALFEAIKNHRRWPLPLLVIVVPLAFSIYTFNTYHTPSKSVKVSVLQPNIDPYQEKFVIGQDEQTARMLDLIYGCPASDDYILLPETAINNNLWEEQMEYSYDIQELRAALENHAPQGQLIVGATTMRHYNSAKNSPTARFREDLGHFDIYNSALAIDTTKRVQVHHKSMLVVGVEKIPYPWVVEAVSALMVDLGGATGSLGRDSKRKIFRSQNGTPSAVAICYESAYGEYLARFAADGAKIIFVITNDGWWGNTAGHRQHFALSRLRAIEMRRSIARSANTGISGFIDPTGRVVSSLGWQERGILSESMPLCDTITPYASWGDWVLRLSNLVFLLSVLYYPAYRIKRKNLLTK